MRASRVLMTLLSPLAPTPEMTSHRIPRSAHGPVSPVAPRRSAVNAVVRSADPSFPCAVLHFSGVPCPMVIPATREDSPLGDHQPRASDRCVGAEAAREAAGELCPSDYCDDIAESDGRSGLTSSRHCQAHWGDAPSPRCCVLRTDFPRSDGLPTLRPSHRCECPDR
jgi:hypothetical protein